MCLCCTHYLLQLSLQICWWRVHVIKLCNQVLITTNCIHSRVFLFAKHTQLCCSSISGTLPSERESEEMNGASPPFTSTRTDMKHKQSGGKTILSENFNAVQTSDCSNSRNCTSWDIKPSSRSFSLNSTVMLVRQCGFDVSWRDISDLKLMQLQMGWLSLKISDQ